MTKQQALVIYRNMYDGVPFDRIEETENYFIFSYNANGVVQDPIKVVKRTGKCSAYYPWEDGE